MCFWWQRPTGQWVEKNTVDDGSFEIVEGNNQLKSALYMMIKDSPIEDQDSSMNLQTENEDSSVEN